MAERKLANKKKRANKGRVIRVSSFVYEILDEHRKRMSWDCLLRRLLWLPDRADEREWIKAGRPPFCIEGVLETTTGKFFAKPPDKPWLKVEEDAYEVAILAAARSRTKKVNKPIRLRELP